MSARAGEPPPQPPEGSNEIRISAASTAWFDNHPDTFDARLKRFEGKTEIERRRAESRFADEELDRRMREKLEGAFLEDLEKRRDVQLDNEVADSALKVSTTEHHSTISGHERYVFMAAFVIGMSAAIVLAFLTAGQPLEYRVSPLTGLLVSGGAGLKLHLLKKAEKQGVQGGKDGASPEE